MKIPNGRAQGHQPSEFDPVQLKRGTKVEHEHTTSHAVAQRIAMDHLVEDPNYYKKLAKVHLDGTTMLRAVSQKPVTGMPWYVPALAAAAFVGLLTWTVLRRA